MYLLIGYYVSVRWVGQQQVNRRTRGGVLLSRFDRSQMIEMLFCLRAYLKSNSQHSSSWCCAYTSTTPAHILRGAVRRCQCFRHTKDTDGCIRSLIPATQYCQCMVTAKVVINLNCGLNCKWSKIKQTEK